MKNRPTDEDSARYILEIFVEKFNLRAGHVLRINNFNTSFNERPWESSDFKPGMIYAAERNWVDVLPDGHSFRLTEIGFNEAEERPMNLLSQCTEKVVVERADGTRHENVPALVTAKSVMIADAQVPIAPNDIILRQLPSNLVERLVVTEPGFHAKFHGIPAHYQVKYRHEGQIVGGHHAPNIHITGDNAKVNYLSTDNSVTVQYSSADLTALTDEFSRLRTALLSQASEPEHYTAIGNIATAETAAKAGDESKMKQAISAIGPAAKWALDAAKDIGVDLAAAVLKAHCGIPG